MVCQQFPVKRIYLIGSSMGGCMALSYSALAPDDIKKQMAGLICIEGAGDLAELYHKTNLDDARRTLRDCFGGAPEQVSVAYAGKSMLPNISGVPGQLRIAIISARQDHTVPPELQDQVFKAFKSQGRPVVLLPVEQDHGWPNIKVVDQALDFVLKGGQKPEPEKPKT
jgi:dienelactone hydrolase